MKIVQILGGPYEDKGVFWNLCLVMSDEYEHAWEEEIFYDSPEDALADFEDLRKLGPIDIGGDYE